MDQNILVKQITESSAKLKELGYGLEVGYSNNQSQYTIHNDGEAIITFNEIAGVIGWVFGYEFKNQDKPKKSEGVAKDKK